VRGFFSIERSFSTLARAHSGNTHLAKYAETRDGGDLLAAYSIAQSLPVQAASRCTAHATVLELFLESLYSNLRLHARDVPQPALEHAAIISRLSLLIRPVESDTRTGFLEARALGLETLLSNLGSNSPATSALLMEAIVLRRRLKLLAISQEERHKHNTNLASLLWTYWRVEERDLVVLREEILLAMYCIRIYSEHLACTACTALLLRSSCHTLHHAQYTSYGWYLLPLTHSHATMYLYISSRSYNPIRAYLRITCLVHTAHSLFVTVSSCTASACTSCI
jgi:hypothetical protein